MNQSRNLILCALLVISAGGALAADDKNSAAKAQLRQLQQEKHKLEQDKSQLEQDKANLETQLKAANAKLDDSGKTADTAGRRSAALQKQLNQENDDKSALQAKVSDLESKLAAAQQQLQADAEQQRNVLVQYAQLKSNLGQSDQTLQSCEVKNQEQYKLGLELLDKYEKKSCFSSLMQNEPFIGVARTKMENELATTKEQLDRQVVVVPKAPAATQ